MILDKLAATHPHPTGHASWAELHAKAASIGRASSPRRSRGVTELAELAAMVGDAHTIVPMLDLPSATIPPGPSKRLLPLRLEWFDDGLFVVGASPAHKILVGRKVESIGGLATEDLTARTMLLLPSATPRFAAEYVPEWLNSELVLRHIGALKGRSASIVADGLKTSVAPVLPTQQFDWLKGRTSGPQAEWVAEQDPTTRFANGFIAPKIYYWRIDELRPSGQVGWQGEVDNIATSLRTGAAERLVIDLRNCTGGDGTLVPAAIEMIKASANGVQTVALIGRRTHSACIMLTAALEQAGVPLAGQSTGDAPVHNGETNISVLPVSGVPFLHASLKHVTTTADDRRRWFSPDVAFPFTHANFAAGVDPVLDWARGSAPALAPVNGAIRHYRRSNSDGSNAEQVVHFRPTKTTVAVYKWVEKCKTAAYVTASIDPNNWEPRALEAGKVGEDGGQIRIGRIDADLARRTLTVAIDQPGGAITDAANVPPEIPWFLFDYDLADLSTYLQERRPATDFEFAWALVWPEGSDLLSYMARVHAKLVGPELRQGLSTRRFDLQFTEGRTGNGSLWIDAATGAVVEALVSVPNHPGMRDFRLVLDHIEGGGQRAWQRLLQGHWSSCAR